MTRTDLTPDELVAALARAAAGLYPAEAAVGLLVRHGDWPVRLAHAGLVELDEETDSEPTGPRYAWVRWDAAIRALQAGDLPGLRQRREYVAARPAEGGSPVLTPDSPRLGCDRFVWPHRDWADSSQRRNT